MGGVGGTGLPWVRVIDGNQSGPSLKDPLQVSDGPIIRSRAKKIKEAMQGLVQSTWDEARITVHAGVFVEKKSSS